MVTVTYTSLHNFLNLSTGDITAAKTEDLIDTAIDLLNANGAELDNMSGSAGSKTVTLTSAARGAVLNLAAMLYRHRYVDPEQMTVGGITVGSSGTTEQDIERTADIYGRLLMPRKFERR